MGNEVKPYSEEVSKQSTLACATKTNSHRWAYDLDRK